MLKAWNICANTESKIKMLLLVTCSLLEPKMSVKLAKLGYFFCSISIIVIAFSKNNNNYTILTDIIAPIIIKLARVRFYLWTPCINCNWLRLHRHAIILWCAYQANLQTCVMIYCNSLIAKKDPPNVSSQRLFT